MPSNRTLSLIIAALCVLAFAAGAASITNPVIIEGDDEPDERLYMPPEYAEDPPDVDFENGEAEMIFSLGTGMTICVPFLTDPTVQGILVVLVIVGSLILWKLTNLIITAAFIAGFGPALAIGYGVLTFGCEDDEEEDLDDPEFEEGALETLLGDGAEAGQQFVEVATDPTVLFVVLIAIGFIAVAFVMLTSDEEDEDPPDEEDEIIEETVLDEAAIARIAGAAADRIEASEAEDDGLENEVYRAWRAMTDHLAVDDPDTSTPGEFARVAIAGGMDPDDVMGLTGLFEEVRYGERPASAEREQRAVEILRRIERTYASEEDNR